MRRAYIQGSLMFFAVSCTAAPPPEPVDSGGEAVEPCEQGFTAGYCPPDVEVVTTDNQTVSLLQQRGAVALIASEAMW